MFTHFKCGNGYCGAGTGISYSAATNAVCPMAHSPTLKWELQN
jgi:hypothetical protein